ncbi:MAG: hypothetical protein A2539_09510 [Elusimicrobia bacterium RIFOXYD2_FULL_34_15]|nr:MAG: hypothetical protein A2539_09510 [Elusimicrobia bacterium RIFOXYD2_FULL_34_15]
MNILIFLIILPVIAGIIALIVKKSAKILCILTTFLTLVLSVVIFSRGEINFSKQWLSYGIDFSLRAFPFSVICVLFSSLIAFLISLHLIKKENIKIYYFILILINLGIVNGVFLANNFIIFILFWEIAAIILYLSIRIGGENSYITATKSLYIIGFSDFCLLLGIILLWKINGTFNMHKISYLSPSTFYLLPFTLFCIGALAKTGLMPFHTWILDASKDASTEVMAYLPGAVDKLLGIYLLVRIFTEFFKFSEFNFNLSLILMLIGTLTIIISLMLALVQEDLKKTIAYMSISGAGYMLLGISTNTILGIAGGIFYMFSAILWASCLFLCAGNIEKQTGTTNINELGGLAKVMPITFFTMLIASLSISGIPPFNGFFSKWIIYQSLIELYKNSHSSLVILFLIIAMFGSALVLASSVKIIYSTFFGNLKEKFTEKHLKEIHWTMWLPISILSLLCIISGVFANQITLKYLINPSLNEQLILSGFWQPSTATIFIIIGFVIGIVIYLMQIIKNVRKTETYTYGEDPEIFKDGFPGSDFYLSISNARPFHSIYKRTTNGIFDSYNIAISSIKFFSILVSNFIDEYFHHLYEIIENITVTISKLSSSLQGGLLSVYIFWSLVGFMVLLFLLCR